MVAPFEDRPLIATLISSCLLVFLAFATIFTLDISLNSETRTTIYVATGSGLGLAYTQNAVKNLSRAMSFGSREITKPRRYSTILEIAVVFWMILFLISSFLSQLVLGEPIALVGVIHLLIVIIAFFMGIAGSSLPDVSPLLTELGKFAIGILSAFVFVFCLYLAFERLFTGRFPEVTFSKVASLVGPVAIATIFVGGISFILSRLSGRTTYELETNRTPVHIDLESEFDEKFETVLQSVVEEFVTISEDSHKRRSTESNIEIRTDGEVKKQAIVKAEPNKNRPIFYGNLSDELGEGERYWPSRNREPTYPEEIETKRVLEIKIVEVPTKDSDTIGKRVKMRFQALKRVFSDHE